MADEGLCVAKRRASSKVQPAWDRQTTQPVPETGRWCQGPSSSIQPGEPVAQCMSKLSHLLIVGLIIGPRSLAPALAQTSVPSSPGGPSDRPQLQDPGSTGSTCPGNTLSDRLSRCDGVIRPLSGLNPDNTIEPLDTGMTPVIPRPARREAINGSIRSSRMPKEHTWPMMSRITDKCALAARVGMPAEQ